MVMALLTQAGRIAGFADELYEPENGSFKIPLPDGYTDTDFAYLVYVNGAVTVDAVARHAQAVDDRWQLVKTERDRRRFEGGVLVANCWFKSDAQAVGEYTAMAMFGATVPGTTVLRAAWRTMHPDTVTPMTPNLAKQILFAGFSSIAAIDDAALTHFSALQASADPSAYDFSAGWPATYGETP